MKIDKPTLEARKAVLTHQRDTLRNQLVATEGALQDVLHWLGHLEKEEPKPEPKKGEKK